MLTAVAAIACVVAGCGGAESTSYSEQDVVAALEVQADGANWVDPSSGCKAATILTTSEAIATYKDAGDAVATSPDRSVGVKVFAGASTPIDECVKIFESRLAKL